MKNIYLFLITKKRNQAGTILFDFLFTLNIYLSPIIEEFII